MHWLSVQFPVTPFEQLQIPPVQLQGVPTEGEHKPLMHVTFNPLMQAADPYLRVQ
jgi:hypothetical protein